jgi:hypothetical protein
MNTVNLTYPPEFYDGIAAVSSTTARHYEDRLVSCFTTRGLADEHATVSLWLAAVAVFRN